MKKVLSIITCVFLFSCNKEAVIEGIDPKPQEPAPNPAPVVPPPPPTPSTTLVGNFNWRNVWTGKYISVQNNAPSMSTGAYQWSALRIGATNTYYLKSSIASLYLGADAIGNTNIFPTPVAESIWLLEPIGGSNYRMRHNATGGYLNVETGPLRCTYILSGWLSAQWQQN